MNRFTDFLIEASLSQQEKEALWYWQEGNHGKGYQWIRSIANGRYPKVRGIEQLKEIEKDFESALNKLPDVNGKEVIRVTNQYHPYKVGQIIEFEKYTSFSLKPTESLFDNFSSDGSNVFIVKANKSFKNMSKILNTLTDSEHECINTKSIKCKITDIQDKNFFGEERPDWLGGGYRGGYNVKAIYLKIL